MTGSTTKSSNYHFRGVIWLSIHPYLYRVRKLPFSLGLVFLQFDVIIANLRLVVHDGHSECSESLRPIMSGMFKFWRHATFVSVTKRFLDFASPFNYAAGGRGKWNLVIPKRGPSGWILKLLCQIFVAESESTRGRVPSNKFEWPRKWPSNVSHDACIEGLFKFPEPSAVGSR